MFSFPVWILSLSMATVTVLDKTLRIIVMRMGIVETIVLAQILQEMFSVFPTSTMK